MILSENIYKIFNNEEVKHIKNNIKHWINLYNNKIQPSNFEDKEFLNNILKPDIKNLDKDSDEYLFLRYLNRYMLLSENKIILADEVVKIKEPFTGWYKRQYFDDI